MSEKIKKEKKISRRKFLAACAGAVVFAGGGAYAYQNHIWARALRLQPGGAKDAPATYVRQVITEDSRTSRVIMWQSDAKMPGACVEYRRAEADEAQKAPATEEEFRDDGVTVQLYTANLAGLAPGTSYEYRVAMEGQAGPWHSLKTDDGGAFIALIFPDSQSSDYTDWENLAQGAYGRNPETDFFINMGDLVDNGEDHTQWEAWFSAVGGIIDRIPVAPLLGNHETYNEDWKVREPVAYLREFALPENGNEEYARRYYSFDYGPVHFIVLDTQQEEEKEFHPQLLDTELAWFAEDVKKTQKKWKIVLMHRDVLQYRINGRPEREEGFSDEGRLWMPRFEAAGIDVVFTAHLHTYRNRGHLKHFAADPAGPLYILTGVAGNVRYPRLWIDHALDQTIAPQPETDNYLTLKASDDSLDIRCFLPDGTEIDHESVTK